MESNPSILFPGGATKALTLSYDDGTIHDRSLVRILNRFRIKATFHLNSSRLGLPGYLAPDEISSLFPGHEIASHTATHPNLCELDEQMIRGEVMEDLRALTELAGYPVRGFSYPFGAYSDYVAGVLRSMGIAYARTVSSTSSFGRPQDFLLWHPTCHHDDSLMEVSRSFRDLDPHAGGLAVLYVWGHSYEFQEADNWELITQFCSEMSASSSIWCATNIEIYDYLSNASLLEYSEEQGTMRNTGPGSIWICCQDRAVELKPGAVIEL